MNRKYSVAVDFDGVIHSYTSKWVAPEIIPDPPVDGAIDWLNEIAKHFDVVIFTTRGATSEGRVAVATWLCQHGYQCNTTEVTAEKPPALVYIDDRAYRFTGDNFPSAQEIHDLRPFRELDP